MHTGRSLELASFKNHDLFFIQEFVNTKVNNPHLIQQLKVRQLRKIQLQKVKLRYQNLIIQIQKNKKTLLKAEKVYAELKESALAKSQKSFDIQENIIQMKQNSEVLLIASEQCKNRGKPQINIRLKELKDQTEKAVKNLKDEHLSFQASLQKKSLNLSKAVQSKAKLIESLFNQQNEIQYKKNQNHSFEKKKQEMSKLLITLEEKKAIISKKISQNIQFRQEKLKKYSVKATGNKKSEEECIKKLAKFVEELHIIVEDPKSQLEQKKDMINILLNVYSPDKQIQKKARTISISHEKQKHESIQTRISLQDGSSSSIDQVEAQIVEKDPHIPNSLFHTLQQIGKKFGLSNKFKDHQFKQLLNIDKKSINKTTQIASSPSKLNHRVSFSTSLNERDLQDQFYAYCSTQLIELQAFQQVLDETEIKIEKQTLLLREKCKQKDAQIREITLKNRQSAGKS